ncbi:MAG: methylated-DNA--[protein]-cysteine S-methyltransferase [Bacteroidales bacterium]|nr:methylated-DNA--[protein]-cysteine S-methyltransferase [Bacteroidales bacterium]MBN2755864.1 methylated-DNA--[protein]-cysteine S-methyltransferase [Bacteroidales bacterium]
MNKISIQYFKTDFGEFILGSYKNELCLCDWRYRKMREVIDKRIKNGLKSEYYEEKTEITNLAKNQITEYINGKREIFDIPLKMTGTDFQISVWNELIKIPYGKTESYLGLSKKLNNEKAIRAVASANGANAISIFIPCHRIIGRNGELVGYAGGLNTKKKLLQLENKEQNAEQLKLF